MLRSDCSCHTWSWVALAVASGIAGACRNDARSTVSFIARSDGSGQAVQGNACDRRLISQSDVSGILRAPITDRKAVPGDAETCEFTTAHGPHIEVSLRPGLGKVTVKSWLEGKMPLESVPLADVGERAAWQADLHEVIAEQHDVLCDISIMGSASDFVDPSDDALQRRLGALCNKVFRAIQ